jgi:hypothetical protein
MLLARSSGSEPPRQRYGWSAARAVAVAGVTNGNDWLVAVSW